MEPQRTNLISNSTFEGNVSGWPVAVRATHIASADRSLHRYYSMNVVPSGVSPYVGTAEGTEGIPVSSSRFYTYSGWVFVPSGNSETALLEIAWWNSSGNLIRRDQSSSATKGSWQFLYLTAFSPLNAAYASVRLRGTGTYVAGDVFYLEAVRFEQEMFFTSYIPTTNQSVSCNAEHLTYPTSGNIQASVGSISLWVSAEYPPASISLRTFFDSRSAGNNGILIYRNATDQLVLRIGDASNYKETVSSSTMNWAVNSWHHIAATWDSQIQQLYVDGVSVGSTSAPFLPTLFNENMYLGNGVNLLAPAASYFADFAIYNIVLLGLEISAIANRTAPPHAIYGALFFADFDQNKDGYSRIILSPEPTVTAGAEETTGTNWWYRAAQQYEYDKAGDRVKKLDANGQTTRYTYDKRDRLTKVQYPKGTDVTFAYDALSRRISMTDSTGTTTYQYNAADRMTGVISPGNKAVSYEYDMVGRRIQMMDPDGGITHYTYDREVKYWTRRGLGTTLGAAIGGADLVITDAANVVAFWKAGISWVNPRILRKGDVIDGYAMEAGYLCFEGGLLGRLICAKSDAGAKLLMGTPIGFALKGASGQEFRHESIHVVHGRRYGSDIYHYWSKYELELEIEAYLGAGQYEHTFLQESKRLWEGRPEFIPDTYWNEENLKKVGEGMLQKIPKY